MSSEFFVRLGVLGQIGRFRAWDGQQYPRGASVICRTRRGLEAGVVLSPAAAEAARDAQSAAETADGSLLRRQTDSDQLLLSRLDKNRQQAFQACVELLSQHNLTATLMDVEHLFDGRSLYFYFLGEVSAEVDALTQQLADAYDAEVQFRAFAEAVQEGCGPDCGTEEGVGCGTSCGSCSVAAACHGS